MASLAAAIAKVGANTVVSRILGFVRDLVLARTFGADAGTDAFFVAFRIPNLMRRLFAEGAFSMAFVPVLNEYRELQGPKALRDYVDAVAGTLAAALLIVTAVGILTAPVLVLVFAPGFGETPGQRELAAAMLRLTFPYLLFISLTAFAGGILNTFERFGVPAFTPVLLNLSLIGCALYLAPMMDEPILALAWGVLIAGVAQLAFQIPFLVRLGLLPRPRLRPRDPGVGRTLRLMGPTLLGTSVGQLNLLLGTVLASYLATGSISWLYYSDRLMEFPLGILGAALGTVILPRLAQRHAAQDPQAFSQTLDWALRWVLLVGVPAAVGLAALAGPMIGALFYSAHPQTADQGAFTVHDVHMTSRSLSAYAAGLVAFMAIRVLAPGYYARQEVRAPVRMALIAVAVNAALSLALMRPLGHLGLALATTVSAFVNAGLLLRGLIAAGIYHPAPGWGALLARGLAASLVMGILVLAGGAASGGIDGWLALEDRARVARLLLWVGIGAAAYAAALLLGGVRPRDLRESR